MNSARSSAVTWRLGHSLGQFVDRRLAAEVDRDIGKGDRVCRSWGPSLIGACLHGIGSVEGSQPSWPRQIVASEGSRPFARFGFAVPVAGGRLPIKAELHAEYLLEQLALLPRSPQVHLGAAPEPRRSAKLDRAGPCSARPLICCMWVRSRPSATRNKALEFSHRLPIFAGEADEVFDASPWGRSGGDSGRRWRPTRVAAATGRASCRA